MTIRHRRWRLLTAALVIAWLTTAAPAGKDNVDELLRFGTDMARDGNWREAKFRWEQALKIAPSDPRLLNNLAIAEEALGDPAQAKARFEQAIAAGPRDGRIHDNAVRSSIFWGKAAGADKLAPSALPRSAEGEPVKKKGRDVVEVTVSLPLPPRLKLDGIKTILVASFRVNDSVLVDVNRELVRYLRSEFRKHSAFEIQPVNPPPAIPEQTLDEMARNAAFFRWLGRENGSDLIVTGAMRYTRRDASGFQDTDIVSETTGQRVRRQAFVEQEEFTFELDVLYFQGATGDLLFRDRLRRQAIFRGSANDPISAFYELGSSIAGDVISAVATRTRTDPRLLFKG
jgi:hypothetical protein